jgi:hypothetical protein
MAQRNRREGDAGALALSGDHKRRLAAACAGFIQTHHIGELGDFGQQCAHLSCGRAVIQRGDQGNRALQLGEVSLQLAFEGRIEHGVLRENIFRKGRFDIAMRSNLKTPHPPRR